MPTIPLTLRLVKGSKLTFAELDQNFISLRNAINSVSNSDTFVTGGTYNPATVKLDFVGNGGFNPFSVDVAGLTDTYVSNGVYDPGTGCVTFTTTSGYTFDVCGFLTGTTLWTDGSAGSYSLKTINDSGLDATGDYALAQGFQTSASGYGSTASGGYSIASGEYSHAEGYSTAASGIRSHAEGDSTTASGYYSHSEGLNTTASGYASHTEGKQTQATGTTSHAEGYQTKSHGDYSHSEGYKNIASGEASHAEGGFPGKGYFNIASGHGSHAEGASTTASSDMSHAEGFFTVASGQDSHAEGNATTASGPDSHAEGLQTTASGIASHAEGGVTIAIGDYSHSEGNSTTASGNYSHAGGFGSTVLGSESFIHSTNSLLTGDRSVLLGGQNLTGATNDTVYIPYLNINNLGTGTPINNLGIDSNGFVVTGVTTTDTNTYVTGFTFNPSTYDLTIKQNDGQPDLISNLSVLATDVYVVSGVYNPSTGVVTYTNSSGGTFQVSGFVTGITDTFVTGFTYNDANTLTISRNGGLGDLTTSINTMTGLTINGDLEVNGSLNIGTVLSGTPIFNLGIDSSGNVVSGITSNLLYSQTNNYTLGVPITINHNLNTTDVLVQIIDTNTSQLIYGSVDNYQLNSLDITLNTSLNNVKVLVIGSPVSQIVPKGSIVYTLGHDSISPADNNDYFIGQNFNLTPSTSSNDGRRFIVQKTGTVTQVSIKRAITGTLGSSETNNFYVNNVTQATQGFITSGETFDSSSSLTNYTLSTPLNVTAGDKLEIEWLTPAWVTNPTSVRQTFNMVIEY